MLLARRASSLFLRSPPPMSRLAVSPMARHAQRPLCMLNDHLQVDAVCREFSCKVHGEKGAVDLDDVYQEMLDGLAEVEGCFGASRLVCKSEWDYKLIVKFEDLPSLKGFMENEYKSLWTDDFKERVEALSVDGTVKEQSFVYDDIDE